MKQVTDVSSSNVQQLVVASAGDGQSARVPRIVRGLSIHPLSTIAAASGSWTKGQRLRHRAACGCRRPGKAARNPPHPALFVPNALLPRFKASSESLAQARLDSAGTERIVPGVGSNSGPAGVRARQFVIDRRRLPRRVFVFGDDAQKSRTAVPGRHPCCARVIPHVSPVPLRRFVRVVMSCLGDGSQCRNGRSNGFGRAG